MSTVAAYPPVVHRYGAVLDNLRPGVTGEERRRRCGILYLRDRAMAERPAAGWEATAILLHVEALAAVHAFASISAAELEELHHGMLRLMQTAMALDMRGPRSTK
jgi:hypothetical protein